VTRIQILAVKCRLLGVAHEIRRARRHARALQGADRHGLQMFARNRRAVDARALHILYSMLRGRSIDQIEAPNTRSPAPAYRILGWLEDATLSWLVPLEPGQHEELDALRERIKAELRRWNDAIQKRLVEPSPSAA
jgi:hypothetical protein